jgi:PAS domain S-box-containing protein
MKEKRNSSRLSDVTAETFCNLCYEFSTDIIYLLCHDMTIQYVSPSVRRVLGHDPDTCIGQAFSKLNKCSRENTTILMMDFQNLLTGRKIFNSELTCYTSSGREMVFRINGSPFYHKGKIEGAVVTAQDITSQKEYERELKEILGNLRKSLDITIKTISRTVDSKDPYTAGHQQRVSDLARSIATQMDMTSEEIDGIRMAGIMHDIGKISIPAEILSKPGRLHAAEFELIKIHPTIGFDILSSIDFPWPVAASVLFHHERIDGSGYPYGITGEFILPQAKIIGVADVVVAQASHRPYRPSMGIDQALEEIEINSGTLYEPDVVKACLSLFRDKGYIFVT